MNDSRLLILDCKGTVKPIVRFNLELAGFSTSVVTDKEEAINLLENASTVEQGYSCLIVNDYDPRRDPSVLLELFSKGGAKKDCLILFVSRSDFAWSVLEPLMKKYPALDIHVCAPTQVVDFVNSYREAS